MVRPITADSPIWERTEMSMNNLENLQPQNNIENDISTVYKHSLTECSVKLNGIKSLLNRITESDSSNDECRYIAESAILLCDELMRELT